MEVSLLKQLLAAHRVDYLVCLVVFTLSWLGMAILKDAAMSFCLPQL